MRDRCEFKTDQRIGGARQRCGLPAAFRVHVGSWGGGWILCANHAPKLIEHEAARLGDLEMRVWDLSTGRVIAVLRRRAA